MNSEVLATTDNERRPLKVFVTVDVELWPSSWDACRAEFSDSFRRYILGETRTGAFGLPFQLRAANEHGLRFTFLVESLFSCEFGISPLSDIVAQINEAGQDVQLHAHPEWVTHSSKPIVQTNGRYLLSQFTLDEQYRLVDAALTNLHGAGAKGVNAFRAGSFKANADTIDAVSQAGLRIDSSFLLGSEFGTAPITAATSAPNRLLLYPLSTYQDWPGRQRNLQLTACSFEEIVFVLESAWRGAWPAVVLLSHSAELLDRSRSFPDKVVLRRFDRLCRWLADRKHRFVTCGFRDEAEDHQPSCWQPIQSSPLRTILRVGEQVRRRLNV